MSKDPTNCIKVLKENSSRVPESPAPSPQSVKLISSTIHIPYPLAYRSWRLNFNLRFFAVKNERVVQYHHATPVRPS